MLITRMINMMIFIDWERVRGLGGLITIKNNPLAVGVRKRFAFEMSEMIRMYTYAGRFMEDIDC